MCDTCGDGIVILIGNSPHKLVNCPSCHRLIPEDHLYTRFIATTS